jgi:hypothetical protein
MRAFFKITFLVFAALFGLIFIFSFVLPKSLVFYRSPAVSGRIIDSYTGQPIEGATVQVRWSALRHHFIEGADSTDIHTATVMTDSNGFFSIPSWGPVGLAREWHYYEFDPMVTFEKTGYKQSYKDNHDNQDSVTSDAIPFFPVTLKLPSWAGNELELEPLSPSIPARKTANTNSNALEGIQLNSLEYYVIRDNMVEGGRFIDSTDFPSVGYIRPVPNIVITHIQSFSTNIATDSLYDNWHVIGMPDNQRMATGFSITLYQTDAVKIAELERQNIAQHNLLFTLANKPLAETYMAKDAGYSDSVLIPTGPQTLYFPLRNDQNIQEINDALKKLVHQ